MGATMEGMAGNIEAMSASLTCTNDSLGATNASLGATNDGLDGMDHRLAEMTGQLGGLGRSMDGMSGDLGTMVGQMQGLGAGMDGMRAAMQETNRLLVEVLQGINATSAGLNGVGRQLDGLPPRILAEAEPLAARASNWLIPAVIAVFSAWAALVVLLWKILGALQSRRHGRGLPEALFDPAAATR